MFCCRPSVFQIIKKIDDFLFKIFTKHLNVKIRREYIVWKDISLLSLIVISKRKKG